MPKSPDITLQRGVGWPTALWEAKEHIARRAAHKATLGLRALGVQYDQPKDGTLRRFRDREAHIEEGTDGLSFDARTFRVHTSLNPAHRPNEVRYAATWAATAVHEAIHCVRSEQFGSRTETASVAEDIASEGLARMGDYLFAKKFVPKQIVTRLFEIELDMDYSLTKRFMPIATSGATYSRSAQQQLEAMTILYDMPDAALFGAQCINSHLQRGHAYSDLIRQPALELLTIPDATDYQPIPGRRKRS